MRPSNSAFTRLATLALVALWTPMLSAADRPSVLKMLPERTLVAVRIHNITEFGKLMNDTSFGKIAQDPEIKPLLQHLYGSANLAFLDAEKEIGLSLNDLRNIPQGEFCFALVDSGQGNEPGLVMMLDCGESIKDAERLLKFLTERAGAEGETVRVNKHRDNDVQTIGDARIVVKDGAVLMSTNEELIKGLLDVWDGVLKDVSTLSENDSYTTLMKQVSGAKGERPQMTFFVDPMGIAKMATRGNFGALAVMSLMEPLGIYGLKGVGGSLILDTDDFESIAHAHLLLDDPREGALKLIAMKTGDTQPEPWVPGNAASYMTMHWDAQQTYNALRTIVDTVQGEGTTDRLIQGMMDRRLGLDFKEDILKQLQGRATMVTWMEPPMRFNSECRMVGIEVKDPKKAKQLLEKVSERFVESMMPAAHLGNDYYRLPNPQGRRGRRGRRQRPQNEGDQPFDTPERPQADPQEVRENLNFRRPTPAVGVVGDYIVITDSIQLLHEAIKTKRDGGALAEDLEYKLVDGKISRHLPGQDAGMLQFNRPTENLRGIYGAITSPQTIAQIARAAERDQGAKAFHEALTAHPLPPFEVIAKYLAPGGAMVHDGPTGLHMTAFSLRREVTEEEEKE